MSVYSFKITKGKYILSLSTSDKELVEEQFALWVRKASEYVQKHKVQQCKDMVNDQINTEKEITQKKIDEQLRKMPKAEPVEEQPVKEASREEENQIEDEILKTIYYSIKPMGPEDAKAILEGRPQDKFLTFVNIDTGKVNVIFKLKDSNNYGILEPEA